MEEERVLERVMAWLAPREVAAMAMTCSAMAAAARRLTSSRSSDIARGMEVLPVPVVSSSPGYPYFEYSPVSVDARRESPLRFAWGGADQGSSSSSSSRNVVVQELEWAVRAGLFGGGCSCKNCEYDDDANQDMQNGNVSLLQRNSDLSPQQQQQQQHSQQLGIARKRSAAACPCAASATGLAKLLRPDGSDGNGIPAAAPATSVLSLSHECGGACSCSLSCSYRASQRGVQLKLKVAKTAAGKGWGLYAAQDITRDTFVCIYAGEMLTTKEARARQRAYDTDKELDHAASSSLLVLREHLPSGQACLRVNLDATLVGNVARFINHSCDGGNLSPCLIRSAGSCFPRLGFFAGRHIYEGEELTFSYGDVVEQGPKSQPCRCGSPACRGFLPAEAT